MQVTSCCVVVMDHVRFLVLLDAKSFVGVGAYSLGVPKSIVLAWYTGFSRAAGGALATTCSVVLFQPLYPTFGWVVSRLGRLLSRKDNSSWSRGDGTKIRFWHYFWCGDQPLKELYSELFSIACCKGAWVADHLQFWWQHLVEFIFCQTCVGWQVELVIEFLNVLYSFRMRPGGVDNIWWISSKWRKFEVWSFY